MKRFFLILAFACAVLSVSAQNPYISTPYAVQDAKGLHLPQPQTILAIDIEVGHEQIFAGPYARYAQKFFGVRAPLTNKSQWMIADAKIGIMNPEYIAAPAVVAEDRSFTQLHARDNEDFPRMPIDKTSFTVETLETAAEHAAQRIFSLRSHRLELITGEAGEHVFGAGLQSALDEIDRMEQGYLELFFGKKIVKKTTRRYLIYPEKAKKQYVVCRFNSEKGLLPESDLSGEMVLLQIDPSATVNRSMEADERTKVTVTCRMAALSNCVVSLGSEQCGQNVLPILEYGADVAIPVRHDK